MGTANDYFDLTPFCTFCLQFAEAVRPCYAYASARQPFLYWWTYTCWSLTFQCRFPSVMLPFRLRGLYAQDVIVNIAAASCARSRLL